MPAASRLLCVAKTSHASRVQREDLIRLVWSGHCTAQPLDSIVYARLIGAHAMDLRRQNGFEKPDNGRVGDHHAREQAASPMK
jgi:hypothetical protein